MAKDFYLLDLNETAGVGFCSDFVDVDESKLLLLLNTDPMIR